MSGTYCSESISRRRRDRRAPSLRVLLAVTVSMALAFFLPLAMAAPTVTNELFRSFIGMNATIRMFVISVGLCASLSANALWNEPSKTNGTTTPAQPSPPDWLRRHDPPLQPLPPPPLPPPFVLDDPRGNLNTFGAHTHVNG